MWDNDINAKDRPAIAAELGVNMVPNQHDTLPKLYNEETRNRIVQWLDEQERANGKPGVSPTTLKELKDPTTYGSRSPEAHQIWERADDVIGNATASPWRSQDVPPLAEWLDANKERIDLLVEASARPRFFMPSAELLDPSNTDVSILAFSPIQNIREAARVLPTRAMLHAGEGRYEEAWQDILAVYRWARLIGQGETLIDQLIAMAIDGIALHAASTLIGIEGLPDSLLQQIQLDLAALPPVANLSQCYERGERLFGLGIFIHSVRSNAPNQLTSDAFGNSPNWGGLLYLSTDWNLAMVEFNQWFDRLAAAASLTDPVARKQAFSQLDSDSHQLEQDSQRARNWAAALLNRSFRSRHLGGLILIEYLPAFNSINNSENRVATNLGSVRIAAALARYRVANGEYPNDLAQLVPRFIANLPDDSFNVKPFMYRRTADGYLLYSIGENGVDERGSNENFGVFEGQDLDALPTQQADQLRAKIPPGSDDLPIRIPCQPFQIPSLQLPASN